MDDNELNKWLHENVMGLCWHSENQLEIIKPDEDDRYSWYFRCQCGRSSGSLTSDGLNISDRPNYCQSLDAVRAVEQKVVNENQEILMSYFSNLWDVVGSIQQQITATARQRADACKLAWESRQKPPGMARDHFEYNMLGAYVGPKNPVWVEDEL